MASLWDYRRFLCEFLRVDGRDGMLELRIVKRSAGFPYVEGPDVCPTDVRVEEARPFRLERDVCRLIQDLATGILDENFNILIGRLQRRYD
jgi:hypothetical protein